MTILWVCGMPGAAPQAASGDGCQGGTPVCEPAVRRVPCRCTRRGEIVTGSLMGRATWSAACCTCQRPGGLLSRLPRVSGQAGAAASRQPGARTCVLWNWLSEALRSVAMCMRFTGLRTQRFPVSTAPAARRAADGHLVKCRGAQQVLTCSSLRTQLHLTCSRVTCPHPTLVPRRAARRRGTVPRQSVLPRGRPRGTAAPPWRLCGLCTQRGAAGGLAAGGGAARSGCGSCSAAPMQRVLPRLPVPSCPASCPLLALTWGGVLAVDWMCRAAAGPPACCRARRMRTSPRGPTTQPSLCTATIGCSARRCKPRSTWGSRALPSRRQRWRAARRRARCASWQDRGLRQPTGS